ncbi:MAG: M48 family metallopeptidase [Methylobacter sp.]|uniref:M48 family metallopeptidase n=1 Tax=Methylobacter sp. TaxID=2051955 RepID=UPI002720A0B2|nr:M48 family metallopeptidase [Methylobacter sp.]MDO9270121.1 M48 family metallopeptidase [Methylobacter sp.]MDP1664963.1 M48 family metallopeptidase [Methylobacter sp.]
MNSFTIIFLIALTLSFSVQFWLAKRHADYVAKHRSAVPEAFKNTVSLEAHQKAADYTLEKSSLGNIDSIIGVVLLLILTIGGGINWAFEFWATTVQSPLIAGLAALASVFLVMTAVEIPTSVYQTFVIEEKYGFNKSTPQQFIKDQLLQLVLVAAIGMPLLALILWVMDSIGSLWWLWAWGILISFSLLMSWLYPTVIAPLFNKFTPMEEGSLKDRIQGLLARCGFSSQGIFIMDGSKRSGHGNAYFTGLGNNKRIVFFDTLVNSLDDEELEAILAHELGHFKCKHTIKMLIANAVMTLVSFAVLGWLIDQQWFYNGLGVEQPSHAAALLLFMLVSSSFTFFIQPIIAYFQRKFEFEADNFASTNAKAEKLISALVKLFEENASTLTPDPLYSAFHYSHPPAAIRIANLESQIRPA